MADHSKMKLGKKHARFDSRVPRLARYLDEDMPAAPEIVDYSSKLSVIGMMANDSLGDCTCAAIGHAIQVWTSQATSEVTVPDADIISLYERFGYNPSNPSSDQGAVINDVLTSILSNPLDGHGIDAFASIDIANLSELKTAIYLFGGVDIGLELPASSQSQDIWDVPPGGPVGSGEPGSWGGHSVWIFGYNTAGPRCVTWGALKQMTWAFFNAYCDEAWALQSKDWRGAEHFDYAALTVDMQELLQGKGPTRNFSLTDDKVWMIQDAIQSKLDGAAEDDGIIGNTTAERAQWQDLLAFLNLPRMV